MQRELGGILSPKPLIFGEHDTRYENATQPWNTVVTPHIQLVIQPGEEADVPTIVRLPPRPPSCFFSLDINIDCLPSLNSFAGIQIDLSPFSDITIHASGTSERFSGSISDSQAVSYLWERGYVTSAGACDCLNVVLGNGTAITVNSTSHPDLYWAMRGAGHNFGIHNYVWGGEKLEVLFAALSALLWNGDGSTPVNMAQNWGMVFAYLGSAAEAAPLLAPFDAIPALSEESGDLPYPGIAATQGLNTESLEAGLQVYNVTAERRIFESFRRRIGRNPALARGGVIEHDGYSTADSELEREAWKWAGEVRDLWNERQPGREVHAYVNYANGFESVEEKYGHEAWRLERLRALKEIYGPDNRFQCYNPVIQG
ncbi:hypothetical protein BDW68DRAFT_188818 [Aspergillus falconensis]